MQMLNAIRTNSAKLVLTLLDNEDQQVKHEDGKFHPLPHEFVYLQIQVANQTCTSLCCRAFELRCANMQSSVSSVSPAHGRNGPIRACSV